MRFAVLLCVLVGAFVVCTTHVLQRELQDNSFFSDLDHLQEHWELPDWNLKSTIVQEREFLYFKLHDTDDDDLLDGLELLHSMCEDHAHAHGGHAHAQITSQDFNMVVGVVDFLLSEEDLNDDGYLDYTEFARSRGVSRKPN